MLIQVSTLHQTKSYGLVQSSWAHSRALQNPSKGIEAEKCCVILV